MLLRKFKIWGGGGGGVGKGQGGSAPGLHYGVQCFDRRKLSLVLFDSSTKKMMSWL